MHDRGVTVGFWELRARTIEIPTVIVPELIERLR
jgi:hypothetical protein